MDHKRFPPPSLQDLIDRITGDETFPAQRRPYVLSSIRRLARMLDRPAHAVPADAADLLEFLQNVSHELHGLSLSRLRNIRTDLRLALERQKLLSRNWIRDIEPSPAWQSLLALVADDQYALSWLRPFARFCTSIGVAPDAVDGRASDAYLQARSQEGIVRPRETHKNTVRRWNWCVAHVQGWPQRPLGMPDYRNRRSLPLAAFPASFAAELQAYLARLSVDDPFDETAPPAPLRPRTIDAHRANLVRLASELVHTGFPADQVTSLGVLADHARRIVEAMWQRTGRKRTAGVAAPAGTLRKMAKHWLRRQEAEIERLRRMEAGVRPPQSGLTERNERRLRLLADRSRAQAFLVLPVQTMDRLERKDRGTLKEALAYQLALACEILLHTGLRIINLARLDLDEHFVWTQPGRAGCCHILIPGEQVKNGQRLAIELPAHVVARIRTYIDRFRPRLIAQYGDSSFLFPGGRPGRPKLSVTLGQDITDFTRGIIEGGINPHLFRHVISQILLARNPGSYGPVSRLLGHKTVETAFRHYSGTETAAAFRRLHELLAEERGSRPKVRRTPR